MIDRRERTSAVIREGRELGARMSGQYVPGRKRITDEDSVDGGHVHGDAAGGVSGKADDPGRAREVERVTVIDFDELLDMPRTHCVLAQTVGKESECRTESQRPHRGLRFLARACTVRVRSMNEDRNAGLSAQALGEADVVAVAVGQDESANVG